MIFVESVDVHYCPIKKYTNETEELQSCKKQKKSCMNVRRVLEVLKKQTNGHKSFGKTLFSQEV